MDEKRAPTIHPVKKAETIRDAQLFFISSLPSIGPERAMDILRMYRSPLNALLKVEGWARDVKGIGPKTVEKVKQTLIEEFQ